MQTGMRYHRRARDRARERAAIATREFYERRDASFADPGNRKLVDAMRKALKRLVRELNTVARHEYGKRGRPRAGAS